MRTILTATLALLWGATFAVAEPGPSERLRHLEQAAEHLSAAGATELAGKVRSELATVRQQRVAELKQEVARLNAEIARLEGQPAEQPQTNAASPRLIFLSTMVLRINHEKLRAEFPELARSVFPDPKSESQGSLPPEERYRQLLAVARQKPEIVTGQFHDLITSRSGKSAASPFPQLRLLERLNSSTRSRLNVRADRTEESRLKVHVQGQLSHFETGLPLNVPDPNDAESSQIDIEAIVAAGETLQIANKVPRHHADAYVIFLQSRPVHRTSSRYDQVPPVPTYNPPRLVRDADAPGRVSLPSEEPNVPSAPPPVPEAPGRASLPADNGDRSDAATVIPGAKSHAILTTILKVDHRRLIQEHPILAHHLFPDEKIAIPNPVAAMPPSDRLEALLKLAGQDGPVSVAAQPCLKVSLGHEAEIHEGGDIEIPVPGAASQRKRYGTIVSARIDRRGKQRLQTNLFVQLIVRDFSIAAALNWSHVPGLTATTLGREFESAEGETVQAITLVQPRRQKHAIVVFARVDALSPSEAPDTASPGRASLPADDRDHSDTTTVVPDPNPQTLTTTFLKVDHKRLIQEHPVLAHHLFPNEKIAIPHPVADMPPADRLQALLKLFAQGGPVSVADQTSLEVTPGREAEFHNGGEFEIPVPGAASQRKKFGTIVTARVDRTANQHLQTNLTVQLIARDFKNAVTLNGVRIPGLTTSGAQAQFESAVGETVQLPVAIGGSLPYSMVIFARVDAATPPKSPVAVSSVRLLADPMIPVATADLPQVNVPASYALPIELPQLATTMHRTALKLAHADDLPPRTEIRTSNSEESIRK